MKFIFKIIVYVIIPLLFIGCGSEIPEPEVKKEKSKEVVNESPKHEVRVAIMGSSMSMGFPYAGKSWVDVFEKTLDGGLDKNFKVRRWLSLDMSMTKMMEYEQDIAAFKPHLLIMQVSAADGYIEAFRDRGQILPIFRAFEGKEKRWKGVNRKIVDFKKWSEFVGHKVRAKTKVVVIGPTAWRRGLSPLGVEPEIKMKVKKREFEAVEKLGRENVIQSPQYSLECFRHLVDLDQTRATSHYLHATQAERMGLMDRYVPSFLKATEVDKLPLRGTISELINLKKATSSQGGTFFDLQKLLDGLDAKKMADGAKFYDAIHPRDSVLKFFLQTLFIQVLGSKNYQKLAAGLKDIDWEIRESEKWLNITRSLLASGSHHMAKQALDYVLQNIEKSPELLRMTALVMEHQSEWQKAKAALLLLAQKDPYHSEIWEKLMALGYRSGGWRAVQSLMPLVPFMFYDNMTYRGLYGVELLRRGEIEEASSLVTEAYESGIRSDPVVEAVAEMYVRKTNLVKAMDVLDENIELWSSLPSFYGRMKQWLQYIWEDKGQVEAFQRVLVDNVSETTDVSLLTLNSVVYWRLELWAEAIETVDLVKKSSEKENLPINLKFLNEIKQEAEEKRSLTLERYLNWYFPQKN